VHNKAYTLLEGAFFPESDGYSNFFSPRDLYYEGQKNNSELIMSDKVLKFAEKYLMLISPALEEWKLESSWPTLGIEPLMIEAAIIVYN